MRPQVLLVDDELAVLRALERELQDPRFGVITARSAGEAFALLKAHAIDVISHGQGAMPSFAGQLSEAEIAALADYLAAFSRK